MKTNPLNSSVRFRLSAAMACLAAFAPAAAFAQTTTTPHLHDAPGSSRDARVGNAMPLKKHDRDFVEKAAKASMSEVQISRVAAERTSNPEVRRFAQMMIEDHESANEKLAAFASTHGISLPAKDPNPDKWEKRNAKNFDREYIDKMVADHQDVVKLFEKQAKDGEDPEALAFARDNLPKMQHHLEQALDLKRALKEQH